MSYLRYLCLFAYSGLQHILCCAVFVPRLVCPMLPVSHDCSFMISPLVFSTVYLRRCDHADINLQYHILKV
jgi:hypothetical protein